MLKLVHITYRCSVAFRSNSYILFQDFNNAVGHVVKTMTRAESNQGFNNAAGHVVKIMTRAKSNQDFNNAASHVVKIMTRAESYQDFNNGAGHVCACMLACVCCVHLAHSYA